MIRCAEKLTVVHLRDLPYEVAGYDVYDFFSTYCEVLTMDRTVSSDYPSLCDENQIVEIIMKERLPCFLTGCGVESRIWYREQPPQCFVCRELGHRAQACLSLARAVAVGGRVIRPESVREPCTQLMLLPVVTHCRLQFLPILC